MDVLLLIALILFVVLLLFSRYTKALVNPVRRGAPPAGISQVQPLHQRLLIADMHADSLLYNNPLTVRSRQGQVDLPRLLEGNVAVQVFTCVSRFPIGANIKRSRNVGDLITLTAWLQGWPRSACSSLTQRALFTAFRLDREIQKSAGQLRLLTNQSDLDAFLLERTQHSRQVGAILGAEGGQVLEGNIETLDMLYRVGYRLLSPTHFFDNELGGSMHGLSQQGLTPFGREVIQRMLELNMLIDLAHASTAMIDDVLAIIDRPIIVSHTGVQGVCQNHRNLSDEYLRRVAATGGLVGIGFWDKATGSGDLEGIVRSIRYAVDLIGVDHVGIGSDFDGSVCTPFDASQMIWLTAALAAQGFNETEIAQIMGGNFIRYLRCCLPRY
jgi:microsomal dipeptidase-like Zn-dependent dipeptidase